VHSFYDCSQYASRFTHDILVTLDSKAAVTSSPLTPGDAVDAIPLVQPTLQEKCRRRRLFLFVSVDDLSSPSHVRRV